MAMAGEVLAMWQSGAITESDVHWAVAFIGIAALSLMIQAAMSVGMAIGAMKAQKKVLEVIDEVRAAAMPLMIKSNVLVDDLAPKVRTISEDVAHITSVARSKVDSFEPTVDAINQTVGSANRKTSAQIERFDGMVTSALNATAELAATVHQGIQGPVREISGVLRAFKVGLATFLSGARREPKPIAPVQPIRREPVVEPRREAMVEARNEISFAEYREAMQAKRKDLDLS